MFTGHAAIHLRQRHRDDRICGAGNKCPQLVEFANFQDQLRIEQLVHKTFPVCQINKIRQINDRQMYGMYLLRKEEMLMDHDLTGTEVQELVLFHVTTESRGMKSLEYGLDWRRTWRSKFGRGVSFSDDADYADYYADHSSGKDSRVIIVCTVLVAKTYKVTIKRNAKAGYSLEVPPGDADTTVSPNGRVYVKYNDFDFYPLYMVYYQRRKEDLCKSRYFNKNSANNIIKKNKRFTPIEPELLQEQQHYRKELLRSQPEQRQQKYELWQQQQEQNKYKQQQQRKQEQQQKQQQQQRMQQQYHRRPQQYNHHNNGPQQHHQENNMCFIL